MDIATDGIEVPDELIKAMGGIIPAPDVSEEAPEKETVTEPEKREEEESEHKETKEETKEEEEESKDGLDASKEEEEEPTPHPEKWTPKNNPEYYKKKGKKTREHIKELTTRRFEADQRAEAAESRASELEQRLAEAEAERVVTTGASKDDPRVQQLDEAIELAREDGSDIVEQALKERRTLLLQGERQPVQQQQAPTQQQNQSPPQIDPSAQEWIKSNSWYQETDELGRQRYPQLAAEAQQREEVLRQTMPIGPLLYKRLDKEMEFTLDAWGLKSTPPENDDSPPRKQPKSGLQPNRGGGAEGKSQPTRSDGLTNAEKARMVAVFAETNMDPDNALHRKMYLNQIRHRS